MIFIKICNESGEYDVNICYKKLPKLVYTFNIRRNTNK